MRGNHKYPPLLKLWCFECISVVLRIRYHGYPMSWIRSVMMSSAQLLQENFSLWEPTYHGLQLSCIALVFRILILRTGTFNSSLWCNGTCLFALLGMIWRLERLQLDWHKDLASEPLSSDLTLVILLRSYCSTG